MCGDVGSLGSRKKRETTNELLCLRPPAPAHLSGKDRQALRPTTSSLRMTRGLPSPRCFPYGAMAGSLRTCRLPGAGQRHNGRITAECHPVQRCTEHKVQPATMLMPASVLQHDFNPEGFGGVPSQFATHSCCGCRGRHCMAGVARAQSNWAVNRFGKPIGRHVAQPNALQVSNWTRTNAYSSYMCASASAQRACSTGSTAAKIFCTFTFGEGSGGGASGMGWWRSKPNGVNAQPTLRRGAATSGVSES